MVECPAPTPYFNIATYACTDGSVVPAGFRKDNTYYEIEPCKVSNCDVCTAVATYCSTCKTGYSAYSGTCTLCNAVANCVTCDTDNHCYTCTTGYLPDTSGLCTLCDTTNGYSWSTANNRCEKACTVSHCSLCVRTDGTQCSTCQTGYLGSTCTTCDAANGYSSVGGGICKILCPTVTQCDFCATTTTCQTCLTGYTGSLCDSCTSDYAMSGGICVLQCPSVTHCTTCATTTTCQTCNTGYTNPTCSACATNYAFVGSVCVLQCPSVSHCTTCATPTTCQTCNTGYTGSTCTTCDTDYAAVGSLCVLQCPSVSHCSVCATPTTCQTCSAGYTGSLCDACDTANGYAQVGALCVLQCPSVSNCDVCATTATCQTCSTGYAGSLCNSCAANYAFVGSVCVLQCPSVSHCTTCATPTTCSVCQTGYLGSTCSTCDTNYLMVSGSCVLQCPTVSHCSVCATTTTCQTCETGYTGVLCNTCDTANGYADISGTCVLQCPSITNCDVCKTTTSCQTCATGYGLVGVGCVMQCPTVSHCDVCQTFTTCQTCETGYSGLDCNTCVTNYAKIGSECILQCPSVVRCSKCATPTTCQTCQTGYAGPLCDRCAVGYLADPANPGACIACGVTNCAQCNVANVCAKCSNSMIPVKQGKACSVVDDACKDNVLKCAKCSSEQLCTQCNTGYYLSQDKAICKVTSCSVEFCLECETESTCRKCQPGNVLANNGKNCNLLSLASKDEVYNVFNTETQNAFVQLNRPATDFDVNSFTFYLKDTITGSITKCPQCSAEPNKEFSRALNIKVQTEVESLASHLHATYPLSSLKPGARLLQDGSTEGVLIVENIRLPGTGSNHDVMTYQAFTAFNAIRLIGSLVLAFFNSVHAFWPTYMFSWLQVWAVLPGQFISYSDRFLNWHYKWYLLVANFGDAYTNFRDWNKDGYLCVANESYPFTKLGCSFVDNFGQNFIIIFCILAFCIISALFFRFCKKKIERNRTLVETKPTAASINRELLNQVIKNNGLGMTYFMRFMSSIQPSIMLFCLLQFNTFKNSTNMGVSTFFAAGFFIFYLFTAVASAFLSKKLWVFLKDSKATRLTTLDELAFAEGRSLSFLCYQYSGYLISTGLGSAITTRHVLLPMVEYARALFIGIFIVALKNSPQGAVGLTLMVELARTAYIASLHRLRISLAYSILEYVGSGLLLLYLITKLAANGAADQTSAQLTIGWLLAFVYALTWALTVADIAVDSWITKNKLAKQKADIRTMADNREGCFSEVRKSDGVDKEGQVAQVVLDAEGNPLSPRSNVIVIDENDEFADDKANDVVKSGLEPPRQSSLPPIKIQKIGTLKPTLGESVQSLDKADIVTVSQTNRDPSQDVHKTPLSNSIKRRQFGGMKAEEGDHDFNVFLSGEKLVQTENNSPEVRKKEIKVEPAKPKWEALPQLSLSSRFGGSSSTFKPITLPQRNPETLKNLVQVEDTDIILLDKLPEKNEGTTFQRLGTQKMTEEPNMSYSPIKISESQFPFTRKKIEEDDDIKVERSSLPSIFTRRQDSLPSLPPLKKRTFGKPTVTELQTIEENDVIFLDKPVNTEAEKPKAPEPAKVDKDILDIITQYRTDNQSMMQQMKINSLSRYDRFGKLRQSSPDPK
jgi:hypothetical protein